MKNKKTFSILTLGVLVTIASTFLTFSLAQTWFPPTGPAPTNNTEPPLNVGSEVQYKEGALSLGSEVVLNAGLVFSKNEENSKPTCEEETRGMLWFEDDGGEETFFMCIFNDTEFIWQNLIE